MATATLKHDSSLATREPTDAPASAPSRRADGIPPFWSSLFNATPANDDPHTEKPSALVGGLWIQIR